MRHVQALSSILRFLGIRPKRGHVPCPPLFISELIHVTLNYDVAVTITVR